MTFSQLVEFYIQSTVLKPSSIISYRKKIEKISKFMDMDIDIEDISSEYMQNIYNSKKDLNKNMIMTSF